MPIVETRNLTKVFGEGAASVTALRDVSLSVEAGEFVAVMGPSGCGKSTLLHLIGGLDKPTSGSVTLDGRDLTRLDDDAITSLRRRKVGFVFQFYNLLPILNAEENAALPLRLDGRSAVEAGRAAAAWMTRVGLGDRMRHRPDQLSGGEQQRLAIARALAGDPAILLADEPTGNLDTHAAHEMAVLLRQVSKDWGGTVLLVTHDPKISAYADRIVFLKDGMVADHTVLEPSPTKH